MKTPRPLPGALCALVLLLLATQLRVYADTYDTMRAKWFDYLTYSNAFNASDPDIAAQVASISSDAASAWNDRVTGTFTDRVLNSFDLGDGSFIPGADTPTYDNNLGSYTAHYNLNKTYARLRNLALGYAVSGTAQYHDPAVSAWLVSALDWLHAHKYQEGLYTSGTAVPGLPDGNPSFWWKIGIPLNANDISVLLYNEITANGTDLTKLNSYMAAVGSYAKKPAVEDSGANRVWECTIVALHGVLTKDPDSNPGDTTPYSQTDPGIPDLRYARNHLLYANNDPDPTKRTYSLFAYVEDTGVNLEDPTAKLTGFYRDGSFIQHDHHPYTAGYGASLIYNFALLGAVLNGTSWDLATLGASSGYPANVVNWVYDSYEPVLYKGAAPDSLRGRELSREKNYDHTAGHKIMEGLIRLTDAFAANNPVDAANIKGMIKYWIAADTRTAGAGDVVGLKFYEDASLASISIAKAWAADANVIARGELVGHYAFPSMDRVLHLRPGFGFGLSLFSNLVYNYETLFPSVTDQKLENKRAWFTGDGMTTLYTSDLGQFSDVFWPTINPARLPGITVDTLARADTTSPRIFAGQTNPTPSPPVLTNAYSWVGSAALDYVGLAGMDFKTAEYVQYGASKDERVPVSGSGISPNLTLAAKKSWFMFDDEIVALGAGVTSTDGRTIETVVENRRLNDTDGANAFSFAGSGTLPGTPSAEGSTPATLTSVTSAGLTGNSGDLIGYYFPGEIYPGGATLKALRETRTHSWNQINDNGSTTNYPRNFLTLWFDHGVSPSNAAYGYVLLPGRSASAAASYAGAPDVAIVNNTTSIQAVKEKVHGITAAAFWTDTAQTTAPGTGTDGLTISSDKKAAVVLDNNPPGWLEVAVADPTRLNTGSITTTLNITATSLLSADAGVTVSQLTPTLAFSTAVATAHNRSFRARFITGSNNLAVDDFDAGTAGAAPPGWTVNNSGGTVTVATTANAVDKIVTVADTSSSAGPTMTRTFTAQNSAVTVEFDALAQQTTGLLEIGSLYLGGTQAVGVYFRGNGKFAYYDASGSIQDSATTYAANTWYHIRIAARPDARSFDLFVNDAAAATNVSFRNSVATLDTVRFGGTNTTTGTMQLNNVVVRQQLTAIAEQNFDGTAIGATPAGWTFTGGTGATASVQASLWTATDDHALKLDDQSGSLAVSASDTFAAQPTAFVAEFRVAPLQTNQRVTIALNDGTNDCVLVYFHENGSIRYYNGATLTTLTTYAASSASAFTPYDVRLAVNPVTGRFDLYLNDVRQVAQAAFKTASAAAGLKTLKFTTLSTGTSVTAYVDRVRVYR